MSVHLAKTAGFCMGVRRAVDIVLDMARRKGTGPVYTYGELIHNPQTVELLKKRGITPIASIDDVEEGTVVIRAHGISPQERARLERKQVAIVDATCPKVARVQAIIKKHAALGYTCIIVGDENHPEVAGLLGYAAPEGIAINHLEDVVALPQRERVCVVAQTTQNALHYEQVIEGIRRICPHALVFDTICDSTARRQAEIGRMTAEMDTMIIVGGRNSANTKQLLEISRKAGVPSFQVETAEELKQIDLENAGRIGVSAGASTPNWITDGVVDYLAMYRKERGLGYLGILYRLWLVTIRTDIYSALGSGCLAAAAMMLQGSELHVTGLLIAALYVYSMHTLNRIQDRHLGSIQGNFRDETYLRHKNRYRAVSFLLLAGALALALIAGMASFLSLAAISLLGYLYSFRVFPIGQTARRLRDIPGSKNIFIALGWAVVAALLPAIGRGHCDSSVVLSFLFVFSLVFMKSVITDMVDVQSDRLVGKETFPVIMGERFSRTMVKALSLVLGAVLAGAAATGALPPLALALLAPLFYVWICLELCDKKAQFSSIALEGLFGTIYIIAGVSVLLWVLIAQALSRTGVAVTVEEAGSLFSLAGVIT